MVAIRFLLGLLVALGLSTVAAWADAEAPRIAILAEPATKNAADLLTAELSHRPVALLERTDIDRVLKEQSLSLSGLTADRLPRVGTLLGADGLIFLSVEKVGGKEVLGARLVAVHPGVVIGSWQELVALAEQPAWSSTTSLAVTALLPKLKVTRAEAIPIAVVNLRATRARPEAAELENELTLLLIHRLAHEPSFFVLERLGMEALLAEQRAEPAGFWTGRYLVDGAIEQDLTDPERLTIRVRLQPPGQAAVIPIVHTCRRAELPEAAETLAREIAAKLQRELTAGPWEAEHEAEQYWNDAQWAWAHELFARAATAAETSWALGRRRPETMALRVRAELLAGRPELVVPYSIAKEYLRSYFTERNWYWRAELRFLRGYRTPNVLAKIFTEMPEAERASRLARTQRALELYRGHLDELLAEPGQIPLATEALTIGGAMLEWFHENRHGWDDALRELAARLREVDELATRRVREFRPPSGPSPSLPFWQSKVALMPLWAATPAETLKTYQEGLRQPFKAEEAAILRLTIVHSHDLFPELTLAGASADRRRLWAHFVEELLASTFPGDRWIGRFMLNASAAEESREMLAAKLRADFWAERGRFAQHELPFNYFELLRLPRGGSVTSGQEVNYSLPEDRPEMAFAREFLLYLLTESTPIDLDSFLGLYHPESYTPAHAGEILAAIRAHETRVRAKRAEYWPLQLIRERGQEMLLRFPSLDPAEQRPAALKVTRYWHPYALPQFRDGALKGADFSFQQALYREGRLWLVGSFLRSAEPRENQRRQFIFGIDLKSFATEMIPLEPAPPLAVPRKSSWGGAYLEITPDAIFVSQTGTLSRYDRRQRQWRHFTEMPGVWNQPWLIGGKLYVRLNNSPDGFQVQHFGDLVELDPKSGVPTLLVSDRRNPAESPFDTWWPIGITLRPGPDGRVFFKGIARAGKAKRCYAAYDPAARRWEPLEPAAWSAREGPLPPAESVRADGPDGGWKVESRGGGQETLTFQRGALRVPFRCELKDADKALLARNGSDPTLAVIEQNLMTGLGGAPLSYETPDGVVLSQVFRMPGFWFLPRPELETAAGPSERGAK